MDRIYRDMPPEDIPWNMKTPPVILRSLAENLPAGPCKVIELGCGAGNYLIYFSMKGFDATGVDISGNAIAIARSTASGAGAPCRFVVADVLGDLGEIPDTFDFAYDWELLHHIFPEDREKYVRNVDRLLNPGGRYLSVCFSEDDPQFGGVGKYRRTALETVLYFSSEAELAALFHKHFRIEELKTVDIAGKRGMHKAVCAWMKKGNP